jgi:hypothetical protein
VVRNQITASATWRACSAQKATRSLKKDAARAKLERCDDRRILHAVGESQRLTLVLDAIDVVLHRLSVLEPSHEVEDLRLKAGDCLHQLDGWQYSEPTTEQREALMKRVLALHTVLAKIERETGS